MKMIIISLLIISLIVLSGCGLTEQKCKNIALSEAKEWEDLGYMKGMNRGIEICESDYKPMLEQFSPSKDCMILIMDDINMRYICKDTEGEEVYNMIKDI